MLFASTIGSFIGSVGTSIVLFEQIGVRNTSVVTIAILLLCSILLLWKEHRKIAVVICAGGVILTIILSGWYQQSIEKISGLIYHHDSAYQEIIIRDGTRVDGSTKRFFHTNRSFASGIDPVTKESPFDYLQEVMRLTTTLEPKRILVIGTAGFTYPHRLSKLAYVEQIDAIDIDPVVKPIAEKYFL